MGRSGGFKDALFDATGRHGLTLLILFFLLIVACFPFRAHGLGEVRPQLILIVVFYWAVHRPYMLRATGAFVCGLMLDLVTGLPPGLSALTLLVAQIVTSSQQKFLLAQTYFVVWSCFALLAFLCGFLQWGVLSLLEMTVFSIKPVLLNALLTALCYPLLSFPLYALLRAMDGRSLSR